MGRKGRQMLATSTEKMLPKLDLAHIFTYLFMLTDVRLPLTMPSSSTARSFFVRMMSAASFETSAAVSTEMPQSLARIAPASFTPSPMKATT